MHGCWQDLPSDLVLSLAEGLSDVDDLVRLRAVCRPWSEALTAGFRPPSAFFPWLALSAGLIILNEYEVPMYSPATRRVNYLPVPTPLPSRRTTPLPSRRTGFVGCHHGWLVAVDASLDVHVFNPLTGGRANLPSFSALNIARVAVQKVALSSTPSSAATGASDDIVAAAVYNRFNGVNNIVFAKFGDDAWSGSITLPFRVLDVIYYHGNFFVVGFKGEYQIINPSGPVAVASGLDDILNYYGEDGICHYLNLVLSPSSGHLLLVGRVAWSPSTIEPRFAVRRFNPDAHSPPYSWVEVKDLGDETIFVGGGYAMVLPAGDRIRIARNCIYFLRDSYYSSYQVECDALGNCIPSDDSSSVELFDVEKGVFRPSPLLGQHYWGRYWKRSMFWFLPSLP